MGGEVVLVAVDASKEITDYALEWAVHNVIKAMDSLILLAVLPSQGLPQAAGSRAHQSRIQQFLICLLKKWGLHQNKDDSSHRTSIVDGVDHEGPNRINEVCVQMMRQLCLANNVRQVKTQVKVVSNALMGSVATKAEELGATWVILDRRLKKEGDCCLKQLNCNIIIIDHAIPKFLRSINSRLVKKIDTSGLQNDPTVADMLGVLPAYILDYDSANTPSSLGLHSHSSNTDVSCSSSSTDKDNFQSVTTSTTECQPGKALLHQNSQFMRHGFKTQPTHHSAPYSKSQPLNKVSSFNIDESPRKSSASPMKEITKSHSGLLKTKSDMKQGISPKLPPTTPTPPRKSTDSPWLWRNMGSPTQSKQHLVSRRDSKYANGNDATASPSSIIDRTSSIRKAMSLSIKQPPTPPPLCSVCKHNTPIFGKSPRKFSYHEIERATDGFSSANFLAEGGYGPVYRGVLSDGQVVAVKHQKLVSAQGVSEFCSEVEVLSCAQHRNLVMLVGYCIEKGWLLVYEFACNGSLYNHLHGTKKNEVITWDHRMKVAIGAARGLRYLHEDCRVGCIVHRDFRPNNILLTHDFEPMVGDFGLARWQADGQSAEETRVIGAFGYLAPEYTQTGLITEKADVYAFGIVLMELLSGLKATDLSRSEQQYLPEWGRPLLEKKMIDEIIDPCLEGNFVDKEVECMMYAASLCILPHPERRPRMSKVLRILEGDMPTDMAYQHVEQTATLELRRKNSYKTDRELNQTRDSSPSRHMIPSMHHVKHSPSSLDARRDNERNGNIKQTSVDDVGGSLNQTIQTQDRIPSSHWIQLKHHTENTSSNLTSYRGNECNINVKQTSLDEHGLEKLSSWSLNQTEQLASEGEEYNAYLQGSLVEFIHRMNAK